MFHYTYCTVKGATRGVLPELPYGGVAAGETNHVAEVLLEGVTQPLLISE